MPLIRRPPDTAPAPGAPDAIALEADLRAAETDVRWKAARALGAIPGAAPVLGAASLMEADSRVREAIFTSLARIGSAESVAMLVPHIRADDAERRTGAMDALKSVPAVLASAMPALLSDSDPDVRVLACDLARELPSTEATVLMVQVLDGEPELNVCAAAVDVIADVGLPAALEPLRRCAQRFGDPFLDFAVKIACDRIGEQAPARG